MASGYILDANTFIQAKDREYQFAFAGAFWDWIIAAHKAGLVYSSAKVHAEINAGKPTCPLRSWAPNLPAGFWLPDAKSGPVMGRYAQVIKWAHAQKQFTQKALEDFADADNADAFLIATALHRKMILVTHEGESTDSKARVLVPHAANSLGVHTVTLYDLLGEHATATFKFKP